MIKHHWFYIVQVSKTRHRSVGRKTLPTIYNSFDPLQTHEVRQRLNSKELQILLNFIKILFFDNFESILHHREGKEKAAVNVESNKYIYVNLLIKP